MRQGCPYRSGGWFYTEARVWSHPLFPATKLFVVPIVPGHYVLRTGLCAWHQLRRGIVCCSSKHTVKRHARVSLNRSKNFACGMVTVSLNTVVVRRYNRVVSALQSALASFQNNALTAYMPALLGSAFMQYYNINYISMRSQRSQAWYQNILNDGAFCSKMKLK